jgi:hypothetical protein
MLKSTLPALAFLLMATGCAVREVAPPNPLPARPTVFTDANRLVAPSSEVPAAVNFTTTTQMKLQAAQHWAKIADDAMRSILPTLRKAGKCGVSLDPCKSVYVNAPLTPTEFTRALHSQVVTTLVKSDVQVFKRLPADILVDIEVQPIIFLPNRPQYRYAGVASQLGPGVWALRDVATVDPSDARVVPPTLDALHWFRTEFASGQTPQIEILVTLSVSNKNRYLSRVTNAYYIADGDRHLYYVADSDRPPPGEKVKSAPQMSVTTDCPLDQCRADGDTLGGAMNKTKASASKVKAKTP